MTTTSKYAHPEEGGVANRPATRPQRGVPRRHLNLTPWYFLAIPLFVYLVWVIGPLFYSFYLSLTNWNGITDPSFVGGRNYLTLLHDDVFYTALLNNLKVLAVFLVVPVCGGLALALVMNRSARGMTVMKAAIYSPMALSFIVIGVIWSWLYLPSEGLINTLLRDVGLKVIAQNWLGSSQLAIFSVTLAACWRQIAYVMILYLAGLKTVDPTFIDAAKVDGANGWQTFWNVLLPLLAPTTVVIVVVTIVDSLRFFDLVFIMTHGGPGYASTVLSNFMFTETFTNYRYGYGAAIAVVQFLLSFIFIVIYLLNVLRKESEIL